MKLRLIRIVILLPIVLAFSATGCSTIPITVPQRVSGTFSGSTSGDKPIIITLEQEDQAFRGQGAINGQPIAIAGPVTWSAVGSLIHADGSLSLVKLSLSPNGEVLTVESPQQPAITLNGGGTPVSQPPGPFSGKYRAVERGTTLATVTVAQSGSLISGVGTVFGETVGISGQTTAPNKTQGVMTFLDESQVSFEAELAADGQSISLLGLGAPIVLHRD